MKLEIGFPIATECIRNYQNNITMKVKEHYLDSDYRTFEMPCPVFTGFYESIFNYNDEAQDIEWYNEDNDTNLAWDDFTWDYQDYRQRVARAVAHSVGLSVLDNFKCIHTFKFHKLIQPKFYNYTTDQILVSVTVDVEKAKDRFREILEEADFGEYIEDKFRPGYGFVPYYSNKASDWEGYVEAFPMQLGVSAEPWGVLSSFVDYIIEVEEELRPDDVMDDVRWSGEYYINFEPIIKEHTS